MTVEQQITPALRNARKAIQEGNVSAARRQLLQILQDDKENYRAWLWLSGITSQPDASHEYALRAQSIAPDNSMVQDAVEWAEERKQQRRIVEIDPEDDEVEVARIERPMRPDMGLPVRDKPHVVQPSEDDELADDELNSGGVWRWLGVVLVLLAAVAVLTYIIMQGGTFSRAFDPYSNVLASSALIEPGQTGAASVRQTAGVNLARQAPDAWISAESTDNLPPIVVEWQVTPTPLAIAVVEIGNSAEIIAQIPGLIPKVALQLEEPLPRWTPTPAPTATPSPTPEPQPTATAIPVLASSESVQFNESRWIDVNLSNQYLIAYENGQEVFSTYISSGLPDTPTVIGQFRIYLRYETQHMTGYHLGYDYSLPNVPYVQYFHGNYGLHGAYWHENFGNPMSHGCVNLDESDAAWLYNFADIGTLVNVHY